MDKDVTKSRRELECHATDARGPLELGPGCGLLAGRQDAGVGVQRPHGQAVGRRVGRRAADAGGPLEPGRGRDLLAGRQDAGVGVI